MVSFSWSQNGHRAVGAAHAVGAVRGHRGREDDAALAAELDEGPRGGGGAVPGARDVELEEPVELLGREVQGGLVLGGAGVGDHAVEATLGRDDGVERALDALDGRHVAVLELELAGVLLRQGREVLGRLGDVQAVHAGGVVGEAHLRNAEADALVRAGDCASGSVAPLGDGRTSAYGDSLAMTLSLSEIFHSWFGPGRVER